jgi:carbonic anhydrase
MTTPRSTRQAVTQLLGHWSIGDEGALERLIPIIRRAIDALPRARDGGGELTGLLAKIRPAVSASGPGSSKDDAFVTKVAQANVSQAMKEIREKSPTIKEQLDAGTVGLVGAMYDVSSGKVTFLPE